MAKRSLLSRYPS